MEIMQRFGNMNLSLSGTINTAIQHSGQAIWSFFASFYPVNAEASKLNILIAIADNTSWKHFIPIELLHFSNRYKKPCSNES